MIEKRSKVARDFNESEIDSILSPLWFLSRFVCTEGLLNFCWSLWFVFDWYCIWICVEYWAKKSLIISLFSCLAHHIFGLTLIAHVCLKTKTGTKFDFYEQFLVRKWKRKSILRLVRTSQHFFFSIQRQPLVRIDVNFTRCVKTAYISDKLPQLIRTHFSSYNVHTKIWNGWIVATKCSDVSQCTLDSWRIEEAIFFHQII